MQASSRIIVNTLSQYVRTIINMLLSLYSSRIVLEILGVDDYGIYSLVAGVVSMLSFLTNSLVGSTQRFLSVSQGKGCAEHLKEVFSNSLIVHIILGLAVSILLSSITPFIFNGFLNIPIDRVYIAKHLYLLVILMVYVSFIASPYRALLVSHENIIYISIVDILDGVLKVVLIVLLPLVKFDKLFAYGLIMLGIRFFNLLAYMIYSHIRYEECIFPKLKLFSITYIKDLLKFTSWIVYSSLCISIKMQGLSVVLNKIFGSTINAAYGIGLQISGMISFISSSFNNAVAPQLMTAEGMGNRSRMCLLAEFQSKVSFLLLASIGIPTMFEMHKLLEIWLIKVPDHTMLFGCMFIATQLVDMLSSGLSLANKAIGNIGMYTIITYTPKLLVLPLSWLALKFGMSLFIITIIMFSIEAVCTLLRIYLFRNEVWFNPEHYIVSVILKTIPPVFASIFVCLFVRIFFDNSFRIILTFTCSLLIFTIISYSISLSKQEKEVMKSFIKKIVKIRS